MNWISDKSNTSAWLIFRKDGVLIGKVHALFSTSGSVRVQVWDWSKDEPIQEGKASGYGYDKLTAALSGCTIDGILLTDHCETDSRTKTLLAAYTRKITKAQKEGKPKEVLQGIEKYYERQAKKIGAHFANYTEHSPEGKTAWNDDKMKRGVKGNTWRYTDLYLESGLEKLEMLGYKVYQAI